MNLAEMIQSLDARVVLLEGPAGFRPKKAGRPPNWGVP